MRIPIKFEELIYVIGLCAILISAGTWIMDLTGWVGPCMYCRVERSVIGILGIMLLLPEIPYFKRTFSILVGFFGAQVATQQIFILLSQNVFNHEFFLAICAFILIIIQMALLFKNLMH